MIKNIVANGCSFTEDQPHYVCWPKVVADELDIHHYVNLALGGAGNRYIVTSTVEYLETHPLDPRETLIVIMWSGISRKDIMVSQSWADYFRYTYNSVPQRCYPVASGRDDTVHYMCSGGAAGSWVEDTNASKFFHPLYRAADSASLCKESLHDFVYLHNYLKCQGYQFAFTCFMNLWQTSLVDQGEIDFRIGHNDLSLAQRFDFSNWVFVNSNKDGFAEFALQYNDPMVTDHPSGQSHARFANEIMIPALKGLLK